MNKFKFLSLFSLLIFACCATINKNDYNELYKIKDIYYELSNEYCIILVENQSFEKKILFSNKLDSIKINFNNYIEIKLDSIYKLNIFKDTNKYIINTYNKNVRTGYPYGILLDDILFIENDTVISKIYRSNDIIDKYLIRKNE
jgi:hypothetical protein